MGSISSAEAHELPVVAVTATAVLPEHTKTIFLSFPLAIAAAEAGFASKERRVLIVGSTEQRFGATATIQNVERTDDGSVKIVVTGIERARIVAFDTRDGSIIGRYEDYPLQSSEAADVEALSRAVIEVAGAMLRQTTPASADALISILSSACDRGALVYRTATILELDFSIEQKLLELPTTEAALSALHETLTYELHVLELQREISRKAQSHLTREQREYVLRRQLRAIHDELGDTEDDNQDLAELRDQLAAIDLPEEARIDAERELARISHMAPSAPEYQVARTRVELLLALPWLNEPEHPLDLQRARRILDEDHFGLDEVKERILEHLAVLELNPTAKSPILCFVGPPGVGKTSIGRSIARALERTFERICLGGVHDESELRGHRRTYVGAMPGRIIQALKHAGTNNPVIMLDELDKIGRDLRGDPTGALLEILDPDQSSSFRDNYLESPFDLSKILFIGTANTVDPISPALLDRLELIHLAGYSEEEKIQIARRHLLPKQREATGLEVKQLELSERALSRIITGYTREAGVRELERQIARIARKIALSVVAGETKTWSIGHNDVEKMLGPSRAHDHARSAQPPGVAAALAWTEAGGEVLYVETTLLPRARSATITGHVGEVMRESVRTAQSVIWSLADQLEIDKKLLTESSVHIHIPAGATPKDGPSAGIAVATALASLYTGRAIERGTAMTGEITLTGMVLPIGGLKEKLLAAKRNGFERVIIPAENAIELRNLSVSVTRGLEVISVKSIQEVFRRALAAPATVWKHEVAEHKHATRAHRLRTHAAPFQRR